jgi:hypothetical protein
MLRRFIYDPCTDNENGKNKFKQNVFQLNLVWC